MVRDTVVIIVIIRRVNDAIIVRVIVSLNDGCEVIRRKPRDVLTPPSCGHHQYSSQEEKSKHQDRQALHSNNNLSSVQLRVATLYFIGS